MRKVFLDDDLPKYRNGGIDWDRCIGRKIKFIYDEHEGELEIVKSEPQKVTVKYKEEKVTIKSSHLRYCNLQKVLGIRTDKHLFSIGAIFDNLKYGKLKILKQFKDDKSCKKYDYECLICGNQDYITEVCLKQGQGCNVCSGRKVLKGFNDIWTTNPDTAKLLWNPEEGFIYSSGSGQRVNWKCLDCGNKIEDKSIHKISADGLSCPRCSDGVSYPEKFITNLLSQLKIKFKTQKTFKWSEKRRYDFYLESLNCIIEVHGRQHYEGGFERIGGRTLEEEQENDKIKENLAKNNGIKYYIVIDSSRSELNYIKHKIINSNLNNLLNINVIDWNKCHEYSCNSLLKSACKLWNSGLKNTLEIAKELNLDRRTTTRYLNKGAEIGLCDYDPLIASQNTWSANGKMGTIPIIRLSLEGEYIDEFDSATEAMKSLNISHQNVNAVCKGKRKTTGGFRWMFKDDYEKLKQSITPYIKTSHRAKSIVQLSLEGVFINEYKSITEAQKELNIGNISYACTGTYKSAGGYKWMYKEDYMKTNVSLGRS